MSKKHDFIQHEQNRDSNPASGHKGSAADLELRGANSTNVGQDPADRQAARSGKVENDHNKQGAQAATQKNEPRRTPESRHDRLMTAGSENKVAKRKGGSSGAGAGRGTRGAG